MPTSSWTLTEDDVDFLMRVTRTMAAKSGLRVVVAVVEQGGHLVGLARMDDAKLPSSRVAAMKAWTAAMFRRASGDYQDMTAPGGGAYGLWNAFPGEMVPVAGGEPIWYREICVGAIGVSGGSSEQDQELARFAVSELAQRGGFAVP